MIFIFTIASIILYATAEPILLLRDWISNKLGNNLISRAIDCTPCSSFYISLLIYLTYEFIPFILIYSICISALIMVIQILINKYIEL